MSQKSEFDRLEEFVAKLLNKYDKLREKNTELQTLLHQREEEISELKSMVSSADSERGDISNRIKGIIDQIEDWESALDSDEEDKAQSILKEDDSEELSSEPTADSDEDKDGGLQQNLFNVEPRTGDNIGS